MHNFNLIFILCQCRQLTYRDVSFPSFYGIPSFSLILIFSVFFSFPNISGFPLFLRLSSFILHFVIVFLILVSNLTIACASIKRSQNARA